MEEQEKKESQQDNLITNNNNIPTETNEIIDNKQQMEKHMNKTIQNEKKENKTDLNCEIKDSNISDNENKFINILSTTEIHEKSKELKDNCIKDSNIISRKIEINEKFPDSQKEFQEIKAFSHINDEVI